MTEPEHVEEQGHAPVSPGTTSPAENQRTSTVSSEPASSVTEETVQGSISPLDQSFVAQQGATLTREQAASWRRRLQNKYH